MPWLKRVINRNAALDKNSAGGGGKIDGHIARRHLDQSIAFDDFLTDAGVPGGGNDGGAKKVEVGKMELGGHGPKSKVHSPSP